MKRVWCASIVLSVIVTELLGQSSSAVWPLTNPASSGTGQAVQLSGAIAGSAEAFKNMEINGYTGASSSQRIRMAGTGNTWPINQTTQIDTVYTQFAVTTLPNYRLRIDSVALKMGTASTNNMKANIYYSSYPTFTQKQQVSYTTSSTTSPAGTFLLSGGLDPVRFAPNMMLETADQFFIRIYPWVDNQALAPSGKYLCLQDVTIYATAIPKPVPAGATWPLASDEVPVVSGLVSAGAVTYGGGLYRYGFNANGDRWTIDNGPSGSGSWPAESVPNFSRYAQFAITPLIGGTFVSDSLKFSQIAESSSTLHLAVYFSRSSSFAKKTLVSDTTVPANKTTYAYALRDTAVTGETLYVRFYPYDTSSDPAWKSVDVSGVAVTGFTTGLAILAPTVTTITPSSISTTFATAGGSVTADGGGGVSARGVCWGTGSAPTIDNAKTTDGTGIGNFVSQVRGLTAGTLYYIRAYATNASGTAYGSEQTIMTLSAIVPPTVTTTSPSSVLVKTALSGGNVTAWGGDTVKSRGICWSTAPNPTIADATTADGSGTGTFASGMAGLLANTMYHVRAYATNSAGTGYGSDLNFTTQIPQSDTMVVVAKDGSGNYTTLQAAFRAVPLNYTGKWTIFVKKGSYKEKDTLASGKVNVILLGEDRDSTIIWNDDYGDKYGTGNPGTSGSFTMSIDASDFIAKNITIQNTYAPQAGVSGTQAVALSVNGDRQEYVNVKLLGYQDTYYTRGSTATGRTYHKNCYIEGTVDFIFGRNIVVFDSCTIREIRNGGTLTAAATDPGSQFGYVFRNCTIAADSTGYDGVKITAFSLGRPWQSNPRTVFIKTYEPWNLAPAAWLAWNVTPALYAEYGCFGPGAATGSRVAWSSQLTNTQAAAYSLQNIFAKNSASSNLIVSDWMPTVARPADNLPFSVTGASASNVASLPTGMSLENFPNPFNPETQIQFAVAADGMAMLRVFNLLGQEIARVFQGRVERGRSYQTAFDGSRYPSGVYYCVLESDGGRLARRMLLMK